MRVPRGCQAIPHPQLEGCSSWTSVSPQVSAVTQTLTLPLVLVGGCGRGLVNYPNPGIGASGRQGPCSSPGPSPLTRALTLMPTESTLPGRLGASVPALC